MAVERPPAGGERQAGHAARQADAGRPGVDARNLRVSGERRTDAPTHHRRQQRRQGDSDRGRAQVRAAGVPHGLTPSSLNAGPEPESSNSGAGVTGAGAGATGWGAGATGWGAGAGLRGEGADAAGTSGAGLGTAVGAARRGAGRRARTTRDRRRAAGETRGAGSSGTSARMGVGGAAGRPREGAGAPAGAAAGLAGGGLPAPTEPVASSATRKATAGSNQTTRKSRLTRLARLRRAAVERLALEAGRRSQGAVSCGRTRDRTGTPRHQASVAARGFPARMDPDPHVLADVARTDHPDGDPGTGEQESFEGTDTPGATRAPSSHRAAPPLTAKQHRHAGRCGDLQHGHPGPARDQVAAYADDGERP